MDITNLESSLEQYRSQLLQVDQTLQAVGVNDDLQKLKTDLVELIKLTEDSLLSLKKSELLNQIETIETKSDTCDGLDEEYAAFLAATSDAAEPCGSSSQPNQTECADITTEPAVTSEDVEKSFSQLVGMKCRAPFSQDWGDFSYHNALILSVHTAEDETRPKICVLFCNPLHMSMVPCKYFISGNCNFGDDCRFSHGHLVCIEELQEFMDPDFSKLRVAGKCLALCEEDDVWYPATVVELENDTVTVSFVASDITTSIPVQNVLPVEHTESEDDSSSSSDSMNSDDDHEFFNSHTVNENKTMPYGPSDVTQQFADWEKHTKGIGSKLMIKMGYVMGKGLGVSGEGRTDPVPMLVLPPGKSLDKIMELKAASGNNDIFDAMKKIEKKKKAADKKAELDAKRPKEDIFDFINSKLHGKKGNIEELVHHHHHGQRVARKTEHIVARDLDKKSDKHINIQSLKTQEEIHSVEKKLKHLRESLARNEHKDKKVAKHFTEKISAMTEYLQKLQSSEKAIEQHKQKRKDHRKLAVF
ncbi:zinc finger CCCH-type with G patch domain-containing protein-like [Gigantopelta aegis]|uniref:zinc finger CCCH-type with G patch domain-containing protein-like n=1 Tax=Gigantopelta aegis TaxID=1735272 RepID=UPI001B8892FF|nr:zinc finger CCCH-type with G patch domain-containing protein-like [Gigantopelta aegis]